MLVRILYLGSFAMILVSQSGLWFVQLWDFVVCASLSHS